MVSQTLIQDSMAKDNIQGPDFLLPPVRHLHPGPFVASLALHVCFGAAGWFLASIPAELAAPAFTPKRPPELQHTRIIALLPKIPYLPPPAAASASTAAPRAPTTVSSAPGANAPVRSIPVRSPRTARSTVDLLIQPGMPDLPVTANSAVPELWLIHESPRLRPSFVQPPAATPTAKLPANIEVDLNVPVLNSGYSSPAGSTAATPTPLAALKLPPAGRYPVSIPFGDAPPQVVTASGGSGQDLPNIISIPANPVPRADLIAVPGEQSGSTTSAGHLGDGTKPNLGPPGGPPVPPPMPTTGARVLLRTEYPRSGAYDVAIANAESSVPGSAGLLRGRPVYSVYVSTGTGKDWVLQFAALGTSAAASPDNGTVISLDRISTAPLHAPFAFVILRPPVLHLLDDARYGFVRGIINVNGRFEALQISGPYRFEDPVELLRSLGLWEFRPATRDGVPVPVEVLLCIPTEPRRPRDVSVRQPLQASSTAA
jgi:hypothetical protein